MNEINNTNPKKNIRDPSQKLKDPENMFDEVNENTPHLVINYILPKMMHQNTTTKRLYPGAVIINLYEYPSGSLKDLKIIPKEMFRLRTLSLNDSQISTIAQLPTELPSLRTFVIHDSFRTTSRGSLTSLKGLPNKLPSLEIFGVYNCPIQTLEYIPSSLPKIKKFSVVGCPLLNLRGFPYDVPNLEHLNIASNILPSLKGLPVELPKIKKFNLTGNHLTSLKHIPQKIYKNARIELQNNPLRSLCYLNHNFTFKLMCQSNLYKGFDLGARFDEFMNNFLVPYERINEETGEMETGQAYNMQVIDQMKNYYQKTTTELIQQYISNPKSISEDELERIIWEANIEDRNVLESNFPNDNIVLQKINQRLIIKLSSDLSIFR